MGLFTDFRLTVAEQRLGVYGVHVYQAGRTLGEHRFRSDDRVNLYSAAKTFAAAGVGIAEGEGRFALSDRALDFFPEYREAARPGAEHITILDLLQMRSGHLREDFGRYDAMDRAALFFATDMRAAPGTLFFYEELCTYMLGRIVERVSGQTMLDYLRRRLFGPLEIVNPQWHTCPLGHTVCAGGLYLTTAEFARIGIALLQDGEYKGKQAVPAGYARRMHADWVDTSAKNDPETQGGYGYQLWKCTPPDAYRADGMYGQACVVLPSHSAVITVTAHNEAEPKDTLRALWRDILPRL